MTRNTTSTILLAATVTAAVLTQATYVRAATKFDDEQPHGHPASGAGAACCIALFGPPSARCFRCPRRRRRQ